MIQLDGVYKSYGDTHTFHAVADVNLEVAAGELCVLIGPSGSGKTTTMRMINRLQEPSRGTIRIGGRDTKDLDVNALRRGIGYVIQQVGLFPHMTIGENVSVVLRLLGKDAAVRRRRSDELLDLVGLPPEQFRDRFPRQLSGGQQQRVGVARALAADPPIVLMDEPFGAVDPITRKQLQRELRRIQSELRKTIVFVTHDISEAFMLGDRIVLMNEGRIVQNDTPSNILRRPASRFVSDFIGDDRGLQALQFITLAEIAKPAPLDAAAGGRVLPGDLSVRDALKVLLEGEPDDGGGVLVTDASERPALALSYGDLVRTLANALITDSDSGGSGVRH